MDRLRSSPTARISLSTSPTDSSTDRAASSNWERSFFSSSSSTSRWMSALTSFT
jgi:hypothetical protein